MRLLLVPTVLLIAWYAPGQAHDGIFDWLTTRAALDGGDPYKPLHELAGDYGLVPAFDWLSPHPRLPGALLISAPLALVPLGWVGFVMRLVVLGCLVGVAWFIRPSWLWVLLAVPAFHTVWYGNTSAVVTLLVAVAVAKGWGWPVGVAAALRIWPGFLAVAFLIQGKWKQALSAGVTFGVLNLAGLLLPGATWEGTWSLFVEASDRYASNPSNLMSFVPLWVSLPLGVGALWLSRRRFEWSVVGALALSPVVWLNYLTVLAVPIGKAPRPSEEERGAILGSGSQVPLRRALRLSAGVVKRGVSQPHNTRTKV